MTSSNTHLKLIDCFSSTTLPRTNLTPFTSKLSCQFFSLRHSHLSFFPISLKSKIFPFKVIPFVSQVPGSAQQEFEEEKSGFRYGRDEVIENLEIYDGNLEAKLFVGNFPYDIDSQKLSQFFNQAGIVETSEVIYNRQTNQSRGYGFVTMSTAEQADKAVDMFNQYDINGRLLTVNKAAPKGSRPERITNVYGPSFRMYVGNFPWEVDNARLEELFSEYGKVIDARIVYDRESGRSRGFGFVTMSTETELNNAIAALNGQILDGRAIRVTVAEEKPRRSSF